MGILQATSKPWVLTLCLFFSEGGRFYMDVSLLFGMFWAAASCQDATSLIGCHVNSQCAHVLTYIDDFGGVASTKEQTQVHFHQLQVILDNRVSWRLNTRHLLFAK